MLTTAKMTIIPVLISILSMVDIARNSFTAVHIAEYYNNSNKPIDSGKSEVITQKCPIAFYAKKKACKYQVIICRLERNRGANCLYEDWLMPMTLFTQGF